MARNPLFNILNGGGSILPPNVQNMLALFQQFRKGYNGDPKQQVQQLLDSGKVTPEQYNKAVQMANELQKYLN